MSYEKALPTEQWQQVLLNVSYGDLCHVVRTSTYMYSVASWPDLWVGMKVNMGKVREDGLSQLYSINRFKKITKMDFSRTVYTSEEIERILCDVPGSPLKHIDLSYVFLSQLPTELLTRAVSHLQTVNLCVSRLTTDQCVGVLEASHTSTTLVNLNLSCANLSDVPANLLARGVAHLQTVNLHSTGLRTDQCVKILEASLNSSTLVNVIMASVNLSEVPGELLARAVSHLQTVNLGLTKLTTDQCVNVLETSLSSSTLANLDLNRVDNLRKVPAELLARGVSRLHIVNLGYIKLTTDQCVKLLEASVSSSTLVNVNLTYINLSEVPAELLARAVSQLRSVNLNVTHLTTDQCVKVLEASIISSTLVNVNLRYVNLRQKVPAELLASLPAHWLV